jgi:hypothetical protein
MAQTRSTVGGSSTDVQPAKQVDDNLIITNDLYGDFSQQDDFYISWWSIHLTKEALQEKWPLLERAVTERRLWCCEAKTTGDSYELKVYVPNGIRVNLASKLYLELIQSGIVPATQVLSLKKRASILFELSSCVQYESSQLPEKLLDQLKHTTDCLALEYESDVDAESVGTLISALGLFHRETEAELLQLRRQKLSIPVILLSPALHRVSEVTAALYEALHQLASANDAAFLDAMKAVANLLLAQLASQIDALPEHEHDGAFYTALLQLKQQLSNILQTPEDLLANIPHVMDVTTKTSAMLAVIDSSNNENPKQLEKVVDEYAQFSQGLSKLESARTSSALQKVIKAVATVALAAVGFLLGAVVGCAIGYVAGAWTGPGAAVTAAIGLFKGGVTGSAIALTSGATASSLAAGTIAGCSLFKSPPLPLTKDCTKAVATVASEASHFFRPPV